MAYRVIIRLGPELSTENAVQVQKDKLNVMNDNIMLARYDCFLLFTTFFFILNSNFLFFCPMPQTSLIRFRQAYCTEYYEQC